MKNADLHFMVDSPIQTLFDGGDLRWADGARLLFDFPEEIPGKAADGIDHGRRADEDAEE